MQTQKETNKLRKCIFSSFSIHYRKYRNKPICVFQCYSDNVAFDTYHMLLSNNFKSNIAVILVWNVHKMHAISVSDITCLSFTDSCLLLQHKSHLKYFLVSLWCIIIENLIPILKNYKGSWNNIFCPCNLLRTRHGKTV